MSSLVIVSGDSKGETFELPADKETVIGRVSTCDFSIFDTRMSRRHCVVTPGGDGLVIKDMGSSNGVRVNGKKIAEAVLHDGDRIVLGLTELDFFIADALPDAETEILPGTEDLVAAIDGQAPEAASADETPAKNETQPEEAENSDLEVPSPRTDMSDVLDPVPAPAAQQALVEEESTTEPTEIIEKPEEVSDPEPGEKQPD